MTAITELRETAEIAFHQGYKVRDTCKTNEALAVLAMQLFDLFGPSESFGRIFGVLEVVKQAVDRGDWESGTPALLAIVAKLRQVEKLMEQGGE